ncbi:nuclear transport factor 2 family protein [Streptomyces sp. NPDC058486]|uniref:nuclear transport factor 2 family protein n=1 Tax=unclassified Streptomyces TaxID=2593676 RepID=UPI00365AA96E
MSSSVSTDLYVQVQQFYARQTQALDNGRFEEHAATFTEDGSFSLVPGEVPAVGRAGILQALHDFAKQFENDPVQLRHHFNQVLLARRDDGGLSATVYALLVQTRPGGEPVVGPSLVLHDVIDTSGAELLLRSRVVTYDQS